MTSKPVGHVGIDPSKRPGMVLMVSEMVIAEVWYTTLFHNWSNRDERRRGVGMLCEEIESTLLRWEETYEIVAVHIEDYAPIRTSQVVLVSEAQRVAGHHERVRKQRPLNTGQVEVVMSVWSRLTRARYPVTLVDVTAAKAAVGVRVGGRSRLPSRTRAEIGLQKGQKAHGVKDMVRAMVGRITNLHEVVDQDSSRERIEALADATAVCIAGTKKYKYERILREGVQNG